MLVCVHKQVQDVLREHQCDFISERLYASLCLTAHPGEVITAIIMKEDSLPLLGHSETWKSRNERINREISKWVFDFPLVQR